jgi:hypothetical protein
MASAAQQAEHAQELKFLLVIFQQLSIDVS